MLLKGLFLLGVLVIFVAIVRTGTRGTFAALGVTFVLSYIFGRGKVKNLVIGSIITGICLFLVLFLSHKEIIPQQLMERRITTVFAEEARAPRMNIFTVGLFMIRDNPILGVGLGNFPARFSEYISEAYPYFTGIGGVKEDRGSHNILINIQAELGIIGSLLFLLFIAGIFRKLWHFRNEREASIGMALLLFVLAGGMAADTQYARDFWLLLGLATAIPLIIRNEENQIKEPQ